MKVSSAESSAQSSARCRVRRRSAHPTFSRIARAAPVSTHWAPSATGGLFKNLSLGTLGNSVAGIVGGGVGGQILQALLGIGAASGGLDVSSILIQIAGGGVGGGALMAIIGLVRSMMGSR